MLKRHLQLFSWVVLAPEAARAELAGPRAAEPRAAQHLLDTDHHGIPVWVADGSSPGMFPDVNGNLQTVRNQLK